MSCTQYKRVSHTTDRYKWWYGNNETWNLWYKTESVNYITWTGQLTKLTVRTIFKSHTNHQSKGWVLTLLSHPKFNDRASYDFAWHCQSAYNYAGNRKGRVRNFLRRNFRRTEFSPNGISAERKFRRTEFSPNKIFAVVIFAERNFRRTLCYNDFESYFRLYLFIAYFTVK